MSSSHPEGGRYKQIERKIAQLQSQGLTEGLTFEDQEVLKHRLVFIWREPETIPEATATKSRQSRARHFYRMVQDSSIYLFLAVVLVVPPTILTSRVFQPVLGQLIGIESDDEFRFQLNAKAQKFFESTAAEQGFATEIPYISFMGSMFSAPETRDIKLAYSLVSRDHVEMFFKEILQGVVTSQMWATEEAQGGNTTGCMTIFIPSNQSQDGSCNIMVDRTMLIQSIHKFKMTKLKLD
ncbi:hypothetical protein N7541_000090 [Penicillium brevicompactum]|uniref:Uncharacterized protein n=1 Tax=Penicillium brevicompactum TaxID=5074 RepID=A0A9W9RVP9_PENBR|nr:hypothetical protein N7541_000090 [Penicillium brevicompactum]